MASLDLLARGALNLGLTLSPEQLGLFELYYQLLIDWNRRMNLTAIVDFQEVQTKHFLDSLTVAPVLAGMPPDMRLLDVGTGAGLPGIPLKILFPKLRLVLLDSVAKKARFLHYLVSRLGLDGVEIATGRAEGLAHDASYREQFWVVVARAVAPLPTLLELSLPFCLVEGIFIALKKGDIAGEIELARHALEILGGQLKETRKISLPELEERFLVIFSKVAPTPPAYPRRSGIPAHHPLIK